jgi:NADPH2:quinone reductase
MKAMLCTQWGGPDDLVLRDIPSPKPGPGEVRVRLRAAGLNFADTLLIAGKYQLQPQFPFSPGFEGAGEVIELGAGVTRHQLGDRVATFALDGGYAEQIVIPERMATPIPDSMDYGTAASFIVAYGTSHLALDHRAQLQSGEVLLVHGAAGGVGLTALEIGKKMGATVIATASTAEKLAVCQAYGADHLINYREEDFRRRVKHITKGRGVDVVYDPVGGDVFDQSLRCMKWEGRLLVIGFASGRIPQAQANLLLVKNFSIVGFFWGAYAQKDPDRLEASNRQLLRWFDEGSLKPHVSHTLPLERAADGLKMLLARQTTGRLVLTI